MPQWWPQTQALRAFSSLESKGLAAFVQFFHAQTHEAHSFCNILGGQLHDKRFSKLKPASEFTKHTLLWRTLQAGWTVPSPGVGVARRIDVVSSRILHWANVAFGTPTHQIKPEVSHPLASSTLSLKGFCWDMYVSHRTGRCVHFVHTP
jgi:hypothetical protein